MSWPPPGCGPRARARRVRACLRAQLDPRPPLALAPSLAERGLARAGMDLSDGLSSDLAEMCRQSGVGARVEASAVPVAPAVAPARAGPRRRCAAAGAARRRGLPAAARGGPGGVRGPRGAGPGLERRRAGHRGVLRRRARGAAARGGGRERAALRRPRPLPGAALRRVPRDEAPAPPGAAGPPGRRHPHAGGRRLRPGGLHLVLPGPRDPHRPGPGVAVRPPAQPGGAPGRGLGHQPVDDRPHVHLRHPRGLRRCWASRRRPSARSTGA